MAYLFSKPTAGLLVAAVAALAPLGSMAETLPAEGPSGSFVFSGFGSPQMDNLPLVIGDDSGSAPAQPPMEVVDLGTSPKATGTQPARTSRTIIQNTWSIGVFR